MTKANTGVAKITYDEFGKSLSYSAKANKKSKLKDTEVMLNIQNSLLNMLQGITPPGTGPTVQ